MARPSNPLPVQRRSTGKAKAADPAVVKALFVKAAALFHADQLALAEQTLDRHLALAPGSWPGLCMKAMIAAQTQREPLAEQLWRQLLASNPGYAEGHCQLGILYRRSQRFDEAQAHLQRAIALDPVHLDAQQGLGELYRIRGEYRQALLAFEKVRQLDPLSPQAYFNIGVLYQEMALPERAIAAYQQALQLAPHDPGAHGNLLYCQHYLPRLDAPARFDEARRFAHHWQGMTVAHPPWRETLQPERCLRIGFLSADLRQHPVGYFLEHVLQSLAALDAPGVQLIAFSNAAKEDALSERIRPCFAAWHKVAESSDAALAGKIVAERIDILIDLAGHTAGNRLPVLAARPAPLQLSWLGYFATTGLSAVDYVLADPFCVPAGEESLFVEQVWRLPHTRLCFSPPIDAPPVSRLPALAAGHFTFGSFQDLAKINDTVLALWARILAACPQARLRLQSVRLGHAEMRDVFAQRLAQAGLPADRVELLGPVRRDVYLRACGEIDVILDTFPYPGGTTTAEALWMGVPTLTLSTPGMLGRQGAGLLENVGLSDWVCQDAESYVARAIAWAAPDAAQQPAQRQALDNLRSKLRPLAQASPLFDAPRFARDLADAWRGMWRRRCASGG